MKKHITHVLFVFAAFLSLAALQARASSADWTELKSGISKDFSSISCPEPRTCYLVSGLYLSGGTGGIVKTTDGGETFTLLKSPTLNPLHSISCPTRNDCYIAGDFGTFLKTVDGGETWLETSLGNKSNPPQFTDILALDTQKVMISGRDGIFFRTEDGGATWSRPSIRTVADLNVLYFLDGMTGILAGGDGALFKTSDSGLTWIFLPALRTAGQIVNLRGDGKGLLYSVGNTVNKSTDAGDTWTALSITAGSPKSYQAIAVPDVLTAYLLGDLNSIFKTTDSGATWQLELSAGNVLLRDIACPSATYCLAVGSSGKVFRLGTPPAVPVAPPAVPTPPVPVQVDPVVTSTTAPATLPAQATSQTSAPTSVTPTPAQSVASDAISAALRRSLKRGSRGKDVIVLQELLTTVGVFAKADISDAFGPMTQRAVGKFQAQYGLAKPGQAGYGEAGPKTRAKLIEAAQSGAKVETESVPQASETTPATGETRKTTVLPRTLRKGSRGEDVKRLQELLLADTEISADVEATGYFGPATMKSVGRFQEKYGIASPEDSGYGNAGPKTRAKILEMAE